MVLKVFLFHDLPLHAGSDFKCKFSTIKFNSKKGKDEVLLAALVPSSHQLDHKDLQLRLRNYGEKELGSDWSFEEGSDNYGELEKKAGEASIEFFAHLNEKKVNALVQALEKVLPNLPEKTMVVVPAGFKKGEKSLLKNLEELLEKRVSAKIEHDRFPHAF